MYQFNLSENDIIMDKSNYHEFPIGVRNEKTRDGIPKYSEVELDAHIHKVNCLYFHSTMAFIYTHWRLPMQDEEYYHMKLGDWLLLQIIHNTTF
jgi:hypothetical protein